MTPDPPPIVPSSLIARRSSLLFLVLAVTALRIIYLAFFCPYTLLEDEAHYWEWSRRPDWSYYSKGPGIAWSVAVSTRLLGDSEFAVRLPAVLFAALGTLAIARLAREVTGDPRAGFFAAACALLTPAFQLGGILLTVDMPYVACWALACVAAWKALSGESPRAWAGLGLALGIGFLFKYTILFLIPGLLLYALLARRRPHLLASSPAHLLRSSPPHLWIALGLTAFAACTLPVIIWNARHDWPSIRHLLGHAALPGGDLPTVVNGVPVGPRELRPIAWFLEYVGAQVALFGPVLVLMALAIASALRTRHAQPRLWPGRLFLICAAAPILIVYTALAFWTRVEGNWPVAGYTTLLALAGWGLCHRLCGAQPPRIPAPIVSPPRRFDACRAAWHASLIFGVLVILGAARLDWVHALSGTRTLDRALVSAGLLSQGRSIVPMGRLTGARAMAQDADALGRRLGAETGLEPFYVAEHYGRAGLLAFYLPGRPIVYCSSSQRSEGRRTQYDYWPDTDLGDLDVLAGRPAVLIGSKLERWRVAFDRIESVGRLPSETKKDRQTFLGFGYRGFAHPDAEGLVGPDGGSAR